MAETRLKTLKMCSFSFKNIFSKVAFHGGSIQHTFSLVSQLELLLRGKIKVITKFTPDAGRKGTNIFYRITWLAIQRRPIGSGCCSPCNCVAAVNGSVVSGGC